MQHSVSILSNPSNLLRADLHALLQNFVLDNFLEWNFVPQFSHRYSIGSLFPNLHLSA